MAAQANPFAEIALDGSLLVAAPIAVLAGLVSFLSPCVLPLVPGYLGYVTGLTGVDLAEQKRGRMVAGIGLFVLGFTAVFVTVGVLFTQILSWFTLNSDWVSRILGVVVILMGVVFMGGFSWFQRDRKIHARPPAGLWGAPVLGMVFGLGWAPCIGPTLSAVILMSSGADPDLGRAGLLTFAYCMGLGVPFILIALGLRRGMGALRFFRSHQRAVMLAGGGMLILLGLVMVSGLWDTWVMQLQNWFANEVRLPI
ncbi:cytochrome c biogenesis protein CcdA [Zafaria sp. J156]|nr:cytochrome c biogenesis protein CcdA [Zafaria sp. J156]MEE1621318.1 cytochrome c biogenesis protein CcdA [Zafaria sp. J156]